MLVKRVRGSLVERGWLLGMEWEFVDGLVITPRRIAGWFDLKGYWSTRISSWAAILVNSEALSSETEKGQGYRVRVLPQFTSFRPLVLHHATSRVLLGWLHCCTPRTPPLTLTLQGASTSGRPPRDHQLHKLIHRLQDRTDL